VTEPQQPNVRLPILVPPRPASVHEVASRTDTGRQIRRNYDAVSVFALSLPADDLDLVVLAVADGLGVHARGSTASVVAVEAFSDAFTRHAATLVPGSRWQRNLASILETAFGETNTAILRLGGRGVEDPATTLTVAVIIGDWLCAAHVGNSRVYRLANHELEQLTEDHAAEPEALLTPLQEDILAPTDGGHLASALGVAESSTPSVLFRHIATGDVIAVTSDGLHGLVEGDDLARMLNASRPLEEIAGKLVAAARSRGGEDNISVALARVGSVDVALPEPSIQAERLYGSVAASLLPRYQAEPPARWLPDRIGLVVGLLVSLALVGGFVWWDDYRAATASKAPSVIVMADTSWRIRGDAVAPVAVATAPTDTAVRRIAVPDSASVPTASGAARAAGAAGDCAPGAPVATCAPSVSGTGTPDAAAPAAPAALPAPTRTAAAPATPDSETRRRQVRDSIEAERRAGSDEQHRLESLAVVTAAAARLAQEQRVRDSVANAARQAREEQEARDRQAAEARTEQRTRDEQVERERLRDTRVASGHTALTVWLQNLVRAIDAGDEKAAALASGPPRFAEFVGSNHPRTTDARTMTAQVDEDSGQATAQWTLRWRTNFGTTSQRQMQAQATIARDGENWHVVGWKILEGAP
jgi:protein phosphatase